MNRDRVTFYESDIISLQTASTSKGNQPKWYHKDSDLYIKAQFYYQNKYWRDDLVEIIASVIGSQLNLSDKNVSVLDQYPCTIELAGQSMYGVYSKNFCKKEERYLSFQRIMDLNELDYPFTASIGAKWDFVIDNIKQICQLDYSDYLIVMSIIDFLVGNEDRHLNNFGLLTDENSYKLVPLFDFGLGLFEHDRRYEGLPLRECIKKMECKPFHHNPSKVIDYIKCRYPLENYLPSKISFRDCIFPSAKATSYLLNRCRYLGIEAEGVDY